ncbi:hypothetical protein, partial [Xanthomonas oryzae]
MSAWMLAPAGKCQQAEANVTMWKRSGQSCARNVHLTRNPKRCLGHRSSCMRTCHAHASTPQQALREAALAAPCARMQNACTIAFPAPTFLRKTRKNAAHPTTRAGARYSSLAPGQFSADTQLWLPNP